MASKLPPWDGYGIQAALASAQWPHGTVMAGFFGPHTNRNTWLDVLEPTSWIILEPAKSLKCANSVTAVPWNPVPLVGALPCPQRSIQSIHLQLMASEGGVVWNRPATLETSGRSGDVGEIWIEKQDETGQVAPSSRGFVGLKAACSGTKWLTTAGLTTTPL